MSNLDFKKIAKDNDLTFEQMSAEILDAAFAVCAMMLDDNAPADTVTITKSEYVMEFKRRSENV